MATRLCCAPLATYPYLVNALSRVADGQQALVEVDIVVIKAGRFADPHAGTETRPVAAAAGDGGAGAFRRGPGQIFGTNVLAFTATAAAAAADPAAALREGESG
jgi:hypothetical protein